MVVAVVDKESGKIYFPNIILVFTKSNGVNQVFIFKICFKKCAVNTAKIDKIQASSRHDEECFVVMLCTLGKIFGKIGDMSDAVMKMELSDPNQIIVNTSLVCHAFCAEWNSTAKANGFLILLGLNR
jgi:hypothetical protein